MILGPVQCAGGVIIPPASSFRDVAALCRCSDAVLVLDEIQPGMGRLGTWWGADQEGVGPDVLLVGKGLSGGVVPVRAAVSGGPSRHGWDHSGGCRRGLRAPSVR